MASTYSDRLRLELMGSGDQSGTWGDTTNRNLGTLLEESIAGVANIAMLDADKTLTTNNGTSDEARKMTLKISGTLTATRNVVVPAKEKVYFVDCSTLTGGKVNIKTASGTGVEVSPGFKTMVYCNATNVITILPQALNETATTNDVLTFNGTSWVAGSATALSFSTGMIMMWGGAIADIPSGWILCDGTAPAPDLRDRFVIGASQDDGSPAVAKTNVTGSLTLSGGSKDAIIVSHNHSGSAGGGSHSHSMTFKTTSKSENTTPGILSHIENISGYYTQNTANANHNHNLSINSTGSSGTDANLPPYYALAYIYKL